MNQEFKSCLHRILLQVINTRWVVVVWSVERCPDRIAFEDTDSFHVVLKRKNSFF